MSGQLAVCSVIAKPLHHSRHQHTRANTYKPLEVHTAMVPLSTLAQLLAPKLCTAELACVAEAAVPAAKLYTPDATLLTPPSTAAPPPDATGFQPPSTVA